MLLLCVVAIARDHKPPAGEAANEAVFISAIVFDAEQLKQTVGAGFENDYVVLEVTVRPKTASPYEIRLDDFILRSEMSADHSGPLLAGQIAGSGVLIVKTDDPDSGKRKGGFSAGIGGGMIGSANNSDGTITAEAIASSVTARECAVARRPFQHSCNVVGESRNIQISRR